MGQQADRAESLGDSVGANSPVAANHLYAAAGLLREDARLRAEEYQRQGRAVRRDGAKEA